MSYDFVDKYGLMEGTMLSLEGKSAIITGAGSGMGQAMSVLFAKQGCTVGLCDINEKGVAKTMELIKERSPEAKAYPLIGDVVDYDKVKSLTDDFASKAGTIDILISCAGIVERIAFNDITPEKWDRMVKIHLHGTFHWVKAVIPYMQKQNYGKIVAISSDAGQVGLANCAHYSAAKAGIAALMKTIAKEFAPYQIRANAISPGTIHTGLVPGRTEEDSIARGNQVLLRRQGEPLEVAFMALFLVSKAGDFITGQQIPMNGGETIVGI